MATTTTNNGAAAANHAANGAGNEAGRDHILIFPLMAKGHTLPLLHFATALSLHHRSLRVTMVTTPANVAFARSRLPASVQLAVFPFPSLPPLQSGVESTDALPSPSLYPTFLRATALLREPFAEFLASLPSPPLALVSNFFLAFTRRVVFHGLSCFSTAVCKSLIVSPPPPLAPRAERGASFHVSRMPKHVSITAEEIPDSITNFADPENPAGDRVLHRRDGRLRRAQLGRPGQQPRRGGRGLRGALRVLLPATGRPGLAGRPAVPRRGRHAGARRGAGPRGLPPLVRREGGAVGVRGVRVVRHADPRHRRAARRASAGAGAVWPPFPLGRPVRRVVAAGGRGSRRAHRPGLDPAKKRASAPCRGRVREPLRVELGDGEPRRGEAMPAWPMMAEQHLKAKNVADIIGAGVRIDVIKAGVGGAAAVVVGREEVEKVRRLMDAGGEEGRRMRARAAWCQQAAKSAVSDGGTSRVALQKLVEELRATYSDVREIEALVGGNDTREAPTF